MKITVEEIDILVQANIEGALKEFKKLVPEIKNQVSKIKQEFNNLDLKTKIDAIDTKQVNSSVQKAKKQIKQVFNPDDVSGLTINYKKVINGISEEFDKLKGKKIDLGNAIDLNSYKRKIAEMPKNISKPSISDSSGGYVKYDSNSILNQIEGKTSNDVTPSKKSLSMWDTLKLKIQQIKLAIQQIKSNINGDMFKGISKATPKFDGISSATIKIKNQIKQWSSGLKGGLFQILKYAGALFSLQGIYSLLRSSANSWLSSQNAQAQQLSANIEYMKHALGSVFAGVIQYVTNLVYKLMKAVQSLIYAFSGVNIFAKATASSMKGASKSAKDTNKSLAGAHNEISNVSDNKNSSFGGSSVSPSMDLSKVSNMSNSILDAIKAGDWYQVGSLIAEKLNEAMSNIPWDKIQNTVKNIGKGIAQFLNGFIATTDWTLVGYTIGQGINTALILAYNFLKEYDFKKAGNAFMETIMSGIETIDWGMLANIISEGIKGILDFAIGSIEKIDWHIIIDAILSFIEGIDFSGISDSFFTLLGTALASLVNLGVIIGEYISLAVDEAKQYFQDKIEECGGNVVLGILKGIGDAIIGIGQWIKDHIFTPFIDGFKSVFEIHSPSAVMAELGKFIILGLFEGITSLIGKVIETWNNFKNKIVEIITNTKDKVVEKITDMKDKVTQKFAELKEKAIEKITNLKANAINTFENLKTSISNKVSNIKNSIVTGFENAVSYIKSLPNQALTWGKDLVGNIVNGIKSKIGDVKNAATEVANNIKSFLHFSEPDVGPLSDFHTYMPDMIDLMVKGIHDNVNKVTNELGEMALQMSYKVNAPDISPLSIDAFNSGLVISQPQEGIFDNVFRVLSNNKENQPINLELTVNVGNEKLGNILLDDLRRMKRQTGKDIEAICGEG